MLNMQNQKKIFGTTLKKLREKTGMNQEEFGKCLGKKTTTVSSWENGQSYPTVPVYHQICHLCNCNPDAFSSIFIPCNEDTPNNELLLQSNKGEYSYDLGKFTNKIESAQKDEEMVLAKYRLLSDSQKGYVKALLNSMMSSNDDKENK